MWTTTGEIRDIGSDDVNEYLREITGEDFTAKDFRTWAGTVLATIALQEFEAFDSQAQAKKNIVRAIESVASRLGNTPSVCRKCYVHPGVLDAYLEGTMLDSLRRRASEEMSHVRGLNPEESAVLALLQRRLAEEDREDRSARSNPPPRERASAEPAGSTLTHPRIGLNLKVRLSVGLCAHLHAPATLAQLVERSFRNARMSVIGWTIGKGGRTGPTD